MSERFRDKELIIKRYINSSSLLYFTFYKTEYQKTVYFELLYSTVRHIQ